MAAPTGTAPSVALASLTPFAGRSGVKGSAIVVHFNPASLQLQVSNELKETSNNERKQYIAKTSAKLTMDLLFDTTDTGADVTLATRKIQALLAPPLREGDEARRQVPPPLVLFEWGTQRFKGIAESYRETIDFFSADGVPLRAAINLTLSRQDQVFDESGGTTEPGGAAAADTVSLGTPPGGAAATAADLGAPGAARAIAAANGQENLRFGSGGSISVNGNVTLKAAAAFSPGASARLDISAGAVAGQATSVGLVATARLSATEGAFAGLRTTTSGRSTLRLDPKRLLPSIATATRSLDGAATFGPGGQARLEGPNGLRANVGLSTKLAFD